MTDKSKFRANLQATGIGSFPHLNSQESLDIILENFDRIPIWPQLPRRSLLEDMNMMYSQHLPGVAIRDEKLFVDTDGSFMRQVEQFYERILADDVGSFAISPNYCQGLYALLDRVDHLGEIYAIKGQVTGPFTLGMTITDRERKPIIYHPVLSDVLVKMVIMLSRWQADLLSKICQRVVIFLDEPYLSAYGSSIFAIKRDEVVSRLSEIYQVEGIVWGTHCCSNTDWSLLMEAGVDIISLDAYQYAINLALYAEEADNFLARGGTIAWGIVPTFDEQMDKETVETLEERLEQTIGLLTEKGIDRTQLLKASLITPSCGMGLQTVERTLTIAQATGELSRRMRDKYKL